MPITNSIAPSREAVSSTSSTRGIRAVVPSSEKRLLPDFVTWSRAFFTDDFEIDPAAKAKFWKDPKVSDLLAKLAEKLAAIPPSDWHHDACDHALRALAEAEGVKAGLLINATRVAIVGQAVAPPLFDTMVILGHDRVVNRLRRALPILTAA